MIRNPTYQQVCTGTSGHVEVLLVELNNPEQHFEELIRFFFQFHDPTTKNRQGNDVGFQYASYIFCGDDQQVKIAQHVRDDLQMALEKNAVRAFAGNEVTTLVSPLKEFTPAQEEHQQYLERNPNGYCNHRIRFKQWPNTK
uniref:peptide-methionine (S)-S-oxide reductase n=1 Tax=Entomoneis paludosa TaxID=265537 RepID=A0A7S2V9I3_9STRA